jgi:hypothetical protein
VTAALADGLVIELSEAAYHSHSSLSSTGAKTLLRSPALYQWEREHPKHSDAFDLGTVAHCLVLGTGWDVAVIPDDLLASNGAVSTKAAKDFVAAARADGKVPITSTDHDRARAMADAVLAHPVARVLFERGQSEVSAFWTDAATGIECRARFDSLAEIGSGPAIVDLKTTVDADPRSFGRTAATFGYDLSAAWYQDAHEAVTGYRPPFLHVLVEKEQPHLVSVVQLDDDALWTGAGGAQRAREIYRDCTESGVWPGYSLDIEPVSLPGWARDRYTREIP